VHRILQRSGQLISVTSCPTIRLRQRVRIPPGLLFDIAGTWGFRVAWFTSGRGTGVSARMFGGGSRKFCFFAGRAAPTAGPSAIEACIANERRATNGSPDPRAFTPELANISCAGINNNRCCPFTGVGVRQGRRLGDVCGCRRAELRRRGTEGSRFTWGIGSACCAGGGSVFEISWWTRKSGSGPAVKRKTCPRSRENHERRI
jgi:hypothetical protein